MSEPSDADLLLRYVRDGSHAAFAELVARHLNLVYSVAHRHLPSSAAADDVAQAVFIELARHGRDITPGTPLIAWLHVVARRTALNARRDDTRRRAREHLSAELAAMHTPSPDWKSIEPLLDEAVESLDPTDHHAVLLRFFENKSFREVGAALGLSDDAAQKRVSRALDQLRTLLLRRGLTVTAAGLATELSAHVIVTAPAALGASVAATAAAAAVHSTSVSASLLTMTLLEKSLLTAGLTFTVGAALFDANSLRHELASLRQKADALSAQTRAAQSQHAFALRRLTEARQRLDAQPLPTPATPADAALETTLSAWLERLARIRQMAAAHPELAIPEFQALTDDEWFQFTRNLPADVEGDLRRVMSSLRFIAEGKFATNVRDALRAYLAANGGILPSDVPQLAPFFDPPVATTTLARYKMTAQGKLSDLLGPQRNALIEQHSPLDPELDSVWRIGTNGGFPVPADSVVATDAIKAFTAANHGQAPTHAAQLLPYLRAPIAPARLDYYLQLPR